MLYNDIVCEGISMFWVIKGKVCNILFMCKDFLILSYLSHL